MQSARDVGWGSGVEKQTENKKSSNSVAIRVHKHLQVLLTLEHFNCLRYKKARDSRESVRASPPCLNKPNQQCLAVMREFWGNWEMVSVYCVWTKGSCCPKQGIAGERCCQNAIGSDISTESESGDPSRYGKTCSSFERHTNEVSVEYWDAREQHTLSSQ